MNMASSWIEMSASVEYLSIDNNLELNLELSLVSAAISLYWVCNIDLPWIVFETEKFVDNLCPLIFLYAVSNGPSRPSIFRL